MKLTVASHETGYVVVTDDAVLSVLSRSQLEAAGGAIGGAIGRNMEKRKAEVAAPVASPANLGDLTRIETCKVGELPKALVTSPGWPNVEAFRPVTIYPKRIIQKAGASVWRGVVLTVNGQGHPFAVQMWQVGKVKRHLTEAGYRMA